MANERYIDFFEEKVRELFADGDITEQFKVGDEAEYERIVWDALESENFPESANYKNVKHSIEFRSTGREREIAEEFCETYDINDEDTFESMKRSEHTLIWAILENDSNYDVYITIEEDVTSWYAETGYELEDESDRELDVDEIADFIKDSWDTDELEGELMYNDEFMSEVRQKAVEEGFPESVNLDELDYTINEIQPKGGFRKIAEELQHHFKSINNEIVWDSNDDFVFMVVIDDMIDYKISITSDPEDFNEE